MTDLLMRRISAVLCSGSKDLHKMLDVVACLDIALGLSPEELEEVKKFLAFRQGEKKAAVGNRELMQQYRHWN